MQVPRPKLNYANVIATIALFVALGGVAVAAGLPKNSVGTKQLKRGAVNAAKLKRGAVTAGKIRPRAVVAGKLGTNAVLPGNLGNGIISTAKLADGSVIAGKIKNGVITTNKLDNEAVTTPKLAKDSVTTAKLMPGSVTNPILANGSVTPNKLSETFGPIVSTLRSGQTLRGVFALGGELKVSLDSQSFQFPLLNPPAAPEANVQEAGKTTAACPGITGTATPQAAPGQLCVYITTKSEKFEGIGFEPGATNRLGFGLRASFSEPNPANAVSGQWAVTAP
jgi:hypothetical protein